MLTLYLRGMKVAIIGGGAAGYFAAISVKEHHPSAEVSILEKSTKVLAKVKVSGGGRCNVTNGCATTKQLLQGYPRGAKLLKKLFREFDNHTTQGWFEKHGVSLKTEKDGRVFPMSNSSQTIIDCLQEKINRLGIQVLMSSDVTSIRLEPDSIDLITKSKGSMAYDRVIITTGGSPKRSGFSWLEQAGVEIIPPVPSLFTFNMPQESITSLMGVVVNNAAVNIQGAKLKAEGPLLITHWGMSGPAILKLSSFGARLLADMNYQYKVQVNWVNVQNEELVKSTLTEITASNHHKLMVNLAPYDLPKRFWVYMLAKAGIEEHKKWGDLGKKAMNKLVTIMTNDVYQVSGKTTFKEEFVTCGGVSVSAINTQSLASTVDPRLYFAGEVLDIDGITGGYNFQAAWTTGFIAGQLK